MKRDLVEEVIEELQESLAKAKQIIDSGEDGKWPRAEGWLQGSVQQAICTLTALCVVDANEEDAEAQYQERLKAEDAILWSADMERVG